MKLILTPGTSFVAYEFLQSLGAATTQGSGEGISYYKPEGVPSATSAGSRELRHESLHEGLHGGFGRLFLTLMNSLRVFERKYLYLTSSFVAAQHSVHYSRRVQRGQAKVPRFL